MTSSELSSGALNYVEPPYQNFKFTNDIVHICDFHLGLFYLHSYPFVKVIH